MIENIIQITDSGYNIDMDKMTVNKKYHFTFDGSRYELDLCSEKPNTKPNVMLIGMTRNTKINS